jgi:hypothetical protein
LLGRTILQVRRPVPGQYIKGRWQEGDPPEPFSIKCSVQPTTGERLQTLLEGKRVISLFEIITTTQLKAADPKTSTTGDVVSIFGNDHEIIQVMPWQNSILPHYSCIALREKEGE